MDRIFNFQESLTLGTGLKGMCKNLAVSDCVWEMPLIAVLVLDIADEYQFVMIWLVLKKFSPKKYHFIDKNFIVIFV